MQRTKYCGLFGEEDVGLSLIHISTQPSFTCSISLPNTGMFWALALSRMRASELTTVLSVRLERQSTLGNRASTAMGISAVLLTPLVTISKPYSGASAWYSAMQDSELTSLVV